MLRLPKWFFEWSEKNPTDLMGPAILAGTVTSAVVLAAIITVYPNPNKTVDMQTGPRGIGMAESKFVRENARYDPYEETYQVFERVEAPEGTPTAAEAYGDVIAFGDMDQANFDQLTKAMSAWVGEDVTLVNSPDADQTKLAITKNCIEATQYLNDSWDGHNNASAGSGVNCYSCHRGQPRPPGSWLKAGAVNASAEGWAAIQNRLLAPAGHTTTDFVDKYTQSEYTSLPVDAVEKFLLDGNSIKVSDQASRVAQQPGDPTWQDAERTFSLMNHQANSLNVGCVFCHNTRAFWDPTQVTPQWSITTLGQQMLIDVNQTYYEPRSEILGHESAKVNCMTCHMEVIKPLNGHKMLAEWPELGAAPTE
jgi:photosynthetic reaction center cytochrome c subunit